MSLDFNQWAQEGNKFINDLSEELGHPERQNQIAIVLRSVLHTLRDRLTISESMDIVAQLPMFLKAVYVEGWSYREKPEKLRTLEEFAERVEEEQAKYGETRFDWNMSTQEIAKKVLAFIKKRYITAGEEEDIVSQLPEKLQPLFIG